MYQWDATSGQIAVHPDEVRGRAIALYESGLSCRAVARQLERESGIAVTPQSVARWARELGKSRPVGDRRTAELPEEAARLYGSGLTLKEVARRFRVSPTTARERFREMGVAIRPKGLKYARLADKAWMEAQYWTRGLNAQEIAHRVGCSVLTVHYHLRRHGIPRKRRKRTRT